MAHSVYNHHELSTIRSLGPVPVNPIVSLVVINKDDLSFVIPLVRKRMQLWKFVSFNYF
jgi:hypothetical protein